MSYKFTYKFITIMGVGKPNAFFKTHLLMYLLAACKAFTNTEIIHQAKLYSETFFNENSWAAFIPII